MKRDTRFRADCFPTGRYYAAIAHLIRMPGTADGFDPRAPWAEMPIAMVDLETTGVHHHDRIVEVGIVRTDGVRRSWLVNPGMPIPAEATAVHGITDADVAGAGPIQADEILSTLAGFLPAAFNADFDERHLRAEVPGLPLGVDWLDPLVWSRELYSGTRRLASMVERLGIKTERHHRATDDAEAALAVLLALAPQLPRAYGELVAAQRVHGRKQSDRMRVWSK